MISVFTPDHRANYLDEAYESIRTQSHTDWEWIVLLNNGATYQNDDPRVRICHDATGLTNVGYLKRRACDIATGEILLELDSDDILLPRCLSEIAAAFEDPEVTFAYSNTVNHDIRTDTPVSWDARYGWSQRPFEWNGKQYVESVSADPFPQSISRIWFAPNHARAWRRTAYERMGGHNSTMKISDDHDLMCRTYIDGKMVHIDKPLYLYRVHGENTWLKHIPEIQTAMWACHDRYIEPMAKRWARTNGLRCIDLCGGINKPDGYESVDTHDADVTADLNKPWPFADNSVGVIRAHDAIEHLSSHIHVMNEAWRVLAHGGFFLIRVPSSEGVGADCDPTHVSRWNRRSFRYYTEASVRHYIEHAGCRCRFQKIKVENVTLYDDVAYVVAHLIAIKQDSPRFYGELLI